MPPSLSSVPFELPLPPTPVDPPPPEALAHALPGVLPPRTPWLVVPSPYPVLEPRSRPDPPPDPPLAPLPLFPPPAPPPVLVMVWNVESDPLADWEPPAPTVML